MGRDQKLGGKERGAKKSYINDYFSLMGILANIHRGVRAKFIAFDLLQITSKVRDLQLWRSSFCRPLFYAAPLLKLFLLLASRVSSPLLQNLNSCFSKAQIFLLCLHPFLKSYQVFFLDTACCVHKRIHDTCLHAEMYLHTFTHTHFACCLQRTLLYILCLYICTLACIYFMNVCIHTHIDSHMSSMCVCTPHQQMYVW